MPFKKTLLTLIVLGGVAGWLWYKGLPNLAHHRIESFLTDAGYKPQHIGEIILRPPYVLARDIQLDIDGFNTIGLLRAKIASTDFAIEEVRLDDIRTSTTVETLPALLRLVSAFNQSLPAGIIHIEKMIADFATPYGDLRLETTLNLDATNEDGRRKLSAIVKAQQYQLSFDTRWQGTLGADGTLDMDADILDGRLNIGPARLARLAGWLSWQSRGDEPPVVSGQIDAGSGTLLGLPLQNISLALGNDNLDTTNLVFRTGLSGIANVLLSIDTAINPDGTTFDAALDIRDTDAFFTHIQTMQPKKVPEALRHIGPLRVDMDYRKERRFEGGPFPFVLSASSRNTRLLNGNILFYMDTRQLRGSAETTEDLARAIQTYFSIDEDKRTGGALRLDGTLDDLLKDDQAPKP